LNPSDFHPVVLLDQKISDILRIRALPKQVRVRMLNTSRLLARQTLLKTELVDDLTRGQRFVHAHDRLSHRCTSVWRNESLPQNLLHRFSFCELINQLV
jgi:hypothetical protein